MISSLTEQGRRGERGKTRRLTHATLLLRVEVDSQLPGASLTSEKGQAVSTRPHFASL
jgi:hypothetical protein